MVLLAVLPLFTIPILAIDFVDNGNNSAYSWGFPFPQSCTCSETGVPLSTCELFKCDCICDVTAGKCDYNCCCDPDCSADQVMTDFFSYLEVIDRIINVCGL